MRVDADADEADGVNGIRSRAMTASSAEFDVERARTRSGRRGAPAPESAATYSICYFLFSLSFTGAPSSQ